MQCLQTTVANIELIENLKNLHLQFCGEYMSQSIYNNDKNPPDETQNHYLPERMTSFRLGAKVLPKVTVLRLRPLGA